MSANTSVFTGLPYNAGSTPPFPPTGKSFAGRPLEYTLGFGGQQLNNGQTMFSFGPSLMQGQGQQSVLPFDTSFTGVGELIQGGLNMAKLFTEFPVNDNATADAILASSVSAGATPTGFNAIKYSGYLNGLPPQWEAVRQRGQQANVPGLPPQFPQPTIPGMQPANGMPPGTGISPMDTSWVNVLVQNVVNQVISSLIAMGWGPPNQTAPVASANVPTPAPIPVPTQTGPTTIQVPPAPATA